MLTITEEHERRTLKSKGKSKEENAAFHADSKKDKKGKTKRKGNCHNCGKEGHWTRDCFAEGGGKEGEGPKQKEKKEKEKGDKGKGKKKETAAAAKEKDNEKDDKAKEEEAWMAMVDDELESGCFEETSELTDYPLDHILDLPNLFDGIDESVDDVDEVIEVDQTISAEELVIKTDLDAAYLAGSDETRSAEVDLYDSGTTRHMSGFFH